MHPDRWRLISWYPMRRVGMAIETIYLDVQVCFTEIVAPSSKVMFGHRVAVQATLPVAPVGHGSHVHIQRCGRIDLQGVNVSLLKAGTPAGAHVATRQTGSPGRGFLDGRGDRTNVQCGVNFKPRLAVEEIAYPFIQVRMAHEAVDVIQLRLGGNG